MHKHIALFILILFIILLLSACYSSPEQSIYEANKIEGINNDNSKTTTDLPLPTVTSEEYLQGNLKDPFTSIDLQISQMTLEEKVAQLFIVDTYIISQKPSETSISSESMDFLDTYNIGGIILFGDNIDSRNQTIALINDMQNYSSTPLFIGVDEEGGLVSRVGSKDIGVDHLPNAATISATYSVDQTYDLGLTLGQQLIELGFNLDFAPVLDVNSNPNNPIIGTRAFSDDPTIVSAYGNAFAMGLSQAGIIPSGKHFPGHGDTTTDSHIENAVIEQTLDDLRSLEWLPYYTAIANDIPMIMVGHISTPNITNNSLPASLSEEMLTGYLRQELGFEGLIVTDSLRMNAITLNYTSDQVALMAIQAGCDLLLLPDDFQLAYQGLINAVQDGSLDESRIDASLYRILLTKYVYDIN